MRVGKLVMLAGVILIILSVTNLLPLEAVQVETYRGYPIYYDLEPHMYSIGGLTGLYSTQALARAAIDAYLGPPPPTNRAPFAEVGGPYSGVKGIAVYFYSVGSFDPDGDTLTFSWSFGDGGASTSSSPSHVFIAAGTYTIKLTVKDPAGLTGSDAATCTITEPDAPTPTPPANKAPVAEPGGPYSGKVGQKVDFSAANSYDVDGSIAGYKWELGDTAILYGGTITHTYTATGTYTVKLTVTDDKGLTDAKTTTCIVSTVVTVPGIKLSMWAGLGLMVLGLFMEWREKKE